MVQIIHEPTVLSPIFCFFHTPLKNIMALILVFTRDVHCSAFINAILGTHKGLLVAMIMQKSCFMSEGRYTQLQLRRLKAVGNR